MQTELPLNPDKSYKTILRLGGWMSLLMLVYSFSTILVVSLIGSPPTNAIDAFEMLRENRLNGLLRLDILTVFLMPAYYIIFYSIYLAMRHTDRGLMVICTLFVFVGVTLFLAAPSVFSYVQLSDKYWAAGSETEKNIYLAAAEAVFASDIWNGTGTRVGGILTQLGATVISVLMLRGNVFSRITAYVGIITHGLDLIHIIIGFFAPQTGNMLMLVAGPLYLVWFPLIAFRLFKLSRM